MVKESVFRRFLQRDDVSVDGATDGSTLALSGTNLTQDVVNGWAETSAAGVWTFANGWADGAYSFTAAAMDWSGNSSAAAAPVVVTADTAAQSPFTVNPAPAITVANGATVEIGGVSAQSVTFAGTTGTLKLDDAPAFTGQISGLTGTDAIDLADISYGANTKATFSGNANGGTLTVTNGAQTANITLLGDYLTSGWTLSSDGHGGTVVVDPSLTFPNASNTGVPAGTVLKAYSGPSDITTNGTVLNGYIFTSPLTIDANDVTIENCYFAISGTSANCIDVDSGTGTVITDCTLDGENAAGDAVGGDAIYADNCTISYCNIYGYAKDIYVAGSNVNIIGNYCWNMGSAGEHVEPIFIDGTGVAGETLSNVNISGNTLACNLVSGVAVAGPIFIKDDFGAVSGVTINDNLLTGGGYTVFAETSLSDVTDISVTNNVLGVGEYGYAYEPLTGTGDTWSGNTNLLTGQVVSSTNGTSVNPNIVIASFTPTNSFTIGSSTFAQNIATADVITLTGATLANDPVDVYDGTTLLGTTKANSAGVWSFTTPTLPNGIQAFKATDTVTDITSAVFDVTVDTGAVAPAAPVISTGVENSNASVTLTGTAPDGSTVTVSDGGATALGTATASSTGAWSFTTADLAAGSYAFAATDTTSAGTSAKSSPFDVTVTPPPSDPPAGPVISSIAESPSSGDLNAGKVVTMTLDMSEVVTVNATGGSPTLTLNDGGTATYVGGSGTNVLTFSYTVLAGQNTSDLMETAVNLNGATIKDGAGNAANLSLAGLPQGSPQIDTMTPTISSVVESPSSGDLVAGDTVTLTLNLSEAVTVAGGTPTLALNDGGTATYTSGSGTNALIFSYTVGAGQSTSALAATAVNLKGATIEDGAGNAANVSLTGLTQTGPQIPPAAPVISTGVANSNASVTLTGTAPDGSTVTVSDGGATALGTATASSTGAWSFTTADLAAGSYAFAATDTTSAGTSAKSSPFDVTVTPPPSDPPAGPVISSIAESPSSGDLNAGKVVTMTLDMSEVVTVNATGGSPTLTLNDGGTATYVGGSGTNVLTFSYTVLAGQNTSDLMETAVNLNGATIKDGAGNAANLSLAGLPQGSPQIDTMTPTISSVVESPSSGDLVAGDTVTLTLNLSEAVTVAGGTPTLALNDGGTATYTSGSGTNALIFSYTVGAGQSTSALAATAVNLKGATIEDGAGNAANVSLTGLTQTGPQIPPAAPVISTGVTNSKESVTLTGTAPAGSTVTVSDGGTTALGTATASSTGAWSFTTADLAAGSYAFTATDTTSAGTSAASSAFDVTVADPPAAPVISTGVANSKESVTLTGTAPDGSTVTVSDGGATALGAATASSTGAWSFTTADLAAGTYAFTATDTTSAGTSAASSAFDVTVTPPPPAAPVSVLSTSKTLGAESNKSFAVTGSDTSVTFGAGTNNTVTLQGSGDSVTFGVDSDNTVTLQGSEERVTFGSHSDSNMVTLQGSGDSVTFGSGSSNNTVALGSGDSVSLSGGSANAVTFSGSTGTLILTSPSTFSGEIFNFTGNGSLSDSDQIDLKGINYNSVHDSYANGVLTVTDGTDTVKLDFNGSYTLANFAFASDGNGGTIVYDPPAPSSGQTSGGQGRYFTGTVSGFEARDVFDLPGIGFDAPTTLGYLPGSNQTGGTLPFMDGAQSAKIALLGNYMASSFAVVGDNHGGTMVTEAWQASNQSLLSHPQHT